VSSKKVVKKRAENLTPKQKKFVEGVVKHGNATKAAKDAGYSAKTARFIASENLTKPNILELVEKRREEAMRRAQIHTDVIVGSLAEIATASLADVIPEDEFMARARELGTDHLVKKLKVKTRYISNGPGKEPDREVTHEFEMYSRLDALNQLRDNFGMKEEPRTNTLNERRKKEAEAAVGRIMERDRVDKTTAATTLIGELRAIPNTQGLIEVVSELIN
jgi:hypothetical protein